VLFIVGSSDRLFNLSRWGFAFARCAMRIPLLIILAVVLAPFEHNRTALSAY
jgi:hypothetical protein